MVRFSEINEEHLDVSKPYLPPKSKSLWSGFYAGSKRVFNPFAKSDQPNQGSAKHQSIGVQQGSKIEDLEASEASAPSEIEKTEAGLASAPLEEGARRLVCTEVVEASAIADSQPHATAAPESAASEVEKVRSKTLEELDGLKEAIFGLQSELQLLRRDNGVLRSALCAQTGGSLPVEIAVSPTPSVASLLPKDMSKSKVEQDELVSAAALPEATTSRSSQSKRKADQGSCWQPLFEDCWDSADTQELEDAKSYSQPPKQDPPPASASSPLASTVGASTIGSATPSMPASTAASPQMVRLPPPREPPMDSSREPMTAPMPDSWGRQANPRRMMQDRDRQPNFLGRRAEEQNLSSSSLRPALLPLPLSMLNHPQGAEASEAEESDCPEAPPESDEECPSPPPAPVSPWIPGIEEHPKASGTMAASSKVVLPFPEVPMRPFVDDRA
eukprot:s868_g2.t1